MSLAAVWAGFQVGLNSGVSPSGLCAGLKTGVLSGLPGADAEAASDVGAMAGAGMGADADAGAGVASSAVAFPKMLRGLFEVVPCAARGRGAACRLPRRARARVRGLLLRLGSGCLRDLGACRLSAVWPSVARVRGARFRAA